MSLPPVAIFLSASSVPENSQPGRIVGTLSVVDGAEPYTLSLVDDADGRFALDVNNNLIVSGPLDFEEAPFQLIRLSASGAAITFEDAFLIQVEDVDGISVRLSAADSELGCFHGSGEEDNIKGSYVADKIAARYGDDFLAGRGGNDVLIGGLGQDTLIGGRGADRFYYRILEHSTVAAPDIIGDFSHGQGDKIDLRGIEANSLGGKDFDFVGNTDFSNHSGELRFDLATHLLQGDIDGDGAADFAIEVHAANLARGDLLL